jgi:hypothetical protein
MANFCRSLAKRRAQPSRLPHRAPPTVSPRQDETYLFTYCQPSTCPHQLTVGVWLDLVLMVLCVVVTVRVSMEGQCLFSPCDICWNVQQGESRRNQSINSYTKRLNSATHLFEALCDGIPITFCNYVNNHNISNKKRPTRD